MEGASRRFVAFAGATGETPVRADASHGTVDRTGRVPLVRHRMPVALAAAILAAAAFASHSVGAGAVIAAFLAIVLVVLGAADIESRIIPNRVVLPATAAVLIARVGFFPDQSLEFVLAAAGAGAAFLIPNLINPSMMGMGDVKLAMLLGAGLGRGVIGAIIVAFLSTVPFALATLLRGGLSARRATLPFGPFLAFGALVILIVPGLVGAGGS